MELHIFVGYHVGTVIFLSSLTLALCYMEIIEELYKLADALAARDIPYAVCGGLAVAIHGRPRMTVDIDLVVPSNFIELTAKAAADVGFDDVTGWVKLPKSELGIDRLYRVNKIQGSEFLTLDLLEIDSVENPLMTDLQVFDLESSQISVLSKSSLVRMKQGTGRTQDRLDIEMLSDEVE